MRQLSLRFSQGFVFAAIVTTGATTASDHTNPTWAIVNVNLISMQTETVEPSKTILVRDMSIIDIFDAGSAPLPEGVNVIDGAGKYLMPGLVDMHTHLGLKLPWDGEPTEEEVKQDLLAYLPYGITTIRNMRGNTTTLRIRDAVAKGDIAGPEILTAGPSFHSSLPETFGPKVNTPEEAKTAVKAHVDAGYDFIKVHQNIPLDAFKAVLSEAKNLGVPVVGHAQSDLPPEVSFNLQSLEHTEELDELLPKDKTVSEMASVFSKIKTSGVYITPTLTVFSTIAKYLDDSTLNNLATRPEAALVSPYWYEKMATKDNFFRQNFGPDFPAEIAILREQETRFAEITLALKEHDIPLLLGTDAVALVPPAYSAHQELEKLVEIGFTPYEALLTATVNPARWFGREETAGSLFKGAEADMVLLAGNPLEDIAKTRDIIGVFSNGQWFDQEALDAMLEAKTKPVGLQDPDLAAGGDVCFLAIAF